MVLIMRRRITLAAIAFAFFTIQAYAQVRSTLNNYNNSNITSNGRGAITGPIVNNMFGQIISGAGILGDTNPWTGLNTFNPPIGVASGGSGNTFDSVGNVILPAINYGACTWTSTGDVGPCVNTAIAAAASAGGGTVLLPCGTLGVLTEIQQNTSGVHIVGCGVGTTRDNKSGTGIVAYTILKWLGAAGNPVMYVGPVKPFVTNTVSLYSSDVWGVTADCEDTASIGISFISVNNSFINVGAENCQTTNLSFLAGNTADTPGLQNNDIWAISVSTLNTHSPTGILFDAESGSPWDVSLNRIHHAEAWYNNGDGVVVGNSDHNTFYQIQSFRNPGGTGRAAVCSNSLYTPPNGVQVTGACRGNYFLKLEGTANFQGYQSGSTITAAGGNSCNGGGSSACGANTISTTISATTF